jgi:mono/diheme cytochrome c family protein
LVSYLLSPERSGPGHALYLAECMSCHGERGDRVPAAPLNSRQIMDQRTDQNLIQAVAEGVGSMPAFGVDRGGPLDEMEVLAVVRYTRVLSGSTDPGRILTASGSAGARPSQPGTAPASGSQAAPDRVQALFKSNCAACHPSLSLPKMDRGQILKIIAEGAPEKGMPAYRERLPAEDIEALTQLIASGDAPPAPAGGGSAFAGVVRHVEGWITKHPLMVKESGTQLCTKCHQPSFCTNCHTAGRVR